MQAQNQSKSYHRKIFNSFLLISLISLLITVLTFVIIDTMYRSRINAEIGVMTKIIAQNVANFFTTPEKHLATVQKHIDSSHGSVQIDHEDCIVEKLIELIEPFEIIYLLNEKGIVQESWPYDPEYVGIDLSQQEHFRTDVKHNELIWSKSFISYQTGHPTVAMLTRSTEGIVVAHYNLLKMSEFVSVELNGQYEFIAIIASDGNVIAHSNSKQMLQSENLNNMRSFQKALEGEYGVTKEEHLGIEGVTGVYQAAQSSMYVMMFRSYDEIYGDFFSIYLEFTILLAFSLFILGALIYLQLQNSMKPLEELAGKLASVTRGSYDQSVESKYREFDQLIGSYKSMVQQIQERENDLKESLHEKETLLRELYHRTKNNMQVIISLMKLQNTAGEQADVSETFNKIQSKIEAIAMVHEKLYRSQNLSKISFPNYVEDLIPMLIQNFSSQTKIEYEINIEDINLLIDYAVPCGLILNELTINSIKYAFSTTKKPKIEITGKLNSEETLELTYADNGIGLNDSFSIHNIQSFGLKIVQNLVENQLSGSISIENRLGFFCKIRIPLTNYTERV